MKEGLNKVAINKKKGRKANNSPFQTCNKDIGTCTCFNLRHVDTSSFEL